MALDVRQALRTALDELTSVAGLNVFAVLLVFNVAFGAVVVSFRRQLLALVRRLTNAGQVETGTAQPLFGVEALAVEAPLSLLAALAVVALLTREAVRFWAIQQFAGVSTHPLRDRLPVLVPVAGGLALVLFGLRELVPLLLVDRGFRTWIAASQALQLPLAAVLLVTVYLRQEIALGSSGAVQTVRESVGAFLREPVPTFGLLLVLAVLGALPRVATVAVTYALQPLSDGTVWLLIRTVSFSIDMVLLTFTIAAVTAAYLQVRGPADEGGA